MKQSDSLRGQLEQITEQLRALQQQVELLAGQRAATIVGIVQYGPIEGLTGATQNGRGLQLTLGDGASSR